jgi:hypothetical protein
MSCRFLVNILAVAYDYRGRSRGTNSCVQGTMCSCENRIQSVIVRDRCRFVARTRGLVLSRSTPTLNSTMRGPLSSAELRTPGTLRVGWSARSAVIGRWYVGGVTLNLPTPSCCWSEPVKHVLTSASNQQSTSSVIRRWYLTYIRSSLILRVYCRKFSVRSTLVPRNP